MRCTMDHQSPCTSVTDEEEVEALYASRLQPTYTSAPASVLRPRMCIPISNPYPHPAYRDYPCCSTDDPRRYRVPSQSTLSCTRDDSGCESHDGFPRNYYHQESNGYPGFVTTAVDVHPHCSTEGRNYRKKIHQSGKSTKNRQGLRDMDEILTAQFAALSTSEDETSSTPIKWNRNNIAATMERFEPLEYSYVYTDASMLKHGPDTTRKKSCCHDTKPRAHSKRVPSSDSLAKKSHKLRNGREENPYEEISDESSASCSKQAQRSMISLNQSMMEEEQRRVEDRHKRVLGELNLSVEAMLMPDSDSTDSEKNENEDQVESLSVGPTDDLLSPSSCNPLADLDSGFSGSSSGASYIGSLRLKCGLQRTRSSLSFPGASTPVTASMSRSYVGKGSKGLKRKDCYENPTLIEMSQRSPNHNTSSNNSSQGDGNCKNGNFWSKKSWRKIPGFSSSSAINKAGLSDLLVKYTFRRKSRSTSSDSSSPRTITCETCLKQRC